MNVNSHIQLPRFILNNFRSKNGKVWNLNLNDCKLHSCGTKKLGTQKGYYSQELEQYLNQQIENPFSKLAYKIATFVEQGEESLILPVDAENICKQYISVAAFRSKKAYSDFLKGSLVAGLLDDQTSHDGLAFFSTKLNSGIVPEISESRMMVLANKTDKEFVVPQNCFYLISSNRFPCVIAPITPFCAVGLISKDYPLEKNVNLWLVSDTDDILHMNKQALCMEYVFNHEFVVARRKNELLELKSYLEENQTSLESLKSVCD